MDANRRIPDDEPTKQLYERLKNTPELDGHLEYADGAIIWRRTGKIFLDITCDTLSVRKGAYQEVFHWHPDGQTPGELYEFLCRVGKKGHILVIRDLFLVRTILFAGPKEVYDARYKNRIGKKYIFE